MSVREVRPVDRSARYKLKEIDVPVLERGMISPGWVLKMLEEHHEEGWEVCGVSSTAGNLGIWVFYRRIGPLN